MSPDAAGAGPPSSELARVGSLGGRLVAADEARACLARRLHAALQVREESRRQGAALDEMRARVELRRARVGELLVARRDAARGVDRRREQLQAQIDRVLRLSGAVAAASRRLQDAKEALSGEKARLGDLQRLLRMRQQSMIGQVAALYPVKVFHDLPHGRNLNSNTNGAHRSLSEENGTLPEENGTHLLNVIKLPQIHALTFLGWQIAETASIASAERTCINMTDPKLTVYPLFVECQEDDPTKASYAIYLLHKDTEQLLNYIGAESSGRRVFDNLQELIRIIQSDEYGPRSRRRIAGCRLKICAVKLIEDKAMGVEADHGTPCIRTILRCSIRMSYRYASENWVLLFPVLLLYLLFRSSPGFFAFLLSHSPVIICAALILGVLISHGSTNVAEIKEERKSVAEVSDPKYADLSRNIHLEANKGFSAKENTASLNDGEIKDGLNSSREDVIEVVEMVGKISHDRGSTDSQSDEMKVDSEDKPAGTCKWGRAFSVRRRKKLSDIKVEPINAAVDSPLDSSLDSPFGRVGCHDGSPGFDHDQTEGTTPGTPRTRIASVLDEIDPLSSADFPHPDPIQNDDSDNHMSLQDSRTVSDNNYESDKSKANKNDDKNVSTDPAFLGTVDDDKNVMDLGYSEVERHRRLEILMVKRRSRKNIVFDPDSNLDIDNDKVCKRNPSDILSCSDETEFPGSAPSVLHTRRNPFDHPFEQSDESDLHEHVAIPHQDMFFTRHESFSIGSQGRRPSRFKPPFIIEARDIDEPSASDFQRQFSDKSASTLSTVTESDIISSVADQEDISNSIKNDSSREYESPELPTIPTMGSDIICVGGT
uniref:Uncharacterized protein n=1 Tax=Oryza nivara TaxID=4536 RepID=A0A0E0HG69_ORYNI